MKNKWAKGVRLAVLAFSIIWITIVSVLHQKVGGDVFPSIHAICPFGGLESLYSLFQTGTFISKIFSGTLILFGVTLLLSIVFRRSFCGLLCPFGALQEFFGMIGKKIFGKRLTMPEKIDKPLRYLKYVVLFFTVFYAWKTVGLWVVPYDPWSAYAHLSEGIASVWAESAVGLIILAITIIGSIFYDRFFCKTLCPMGALYGLVGKISPYKVVRNSDTCVDCGMCSKACPVNIDVQHLEQVKTAECLSCQSCVLSCPQKGALELKAGKRRIKPIVAMVLALALFFVPIFITRSLGAYQVLPQKLAEGQVISIEEIKGYMTIEEAAKQTQTELGAFYKLLKIPENVPKTTKLKEINSVASDYDFDAAKEALK